MKEGQLVRRGRRNTDKGQAEHLDASHHLKDLIKSIAHYLIDLIKSIGKNMSQWAKFGTTITCKDKSKTVPLMSHFLHKLTILQTTFRNTNLAARFPFALSNCLSISHQTPCCMIPTKHKDPKKTLLQGTHLPFQRVFCVIE